MRLPLWRATNSESRERFQSEIGPRLNNFHSLKRPYLCCTVIVKLVFIFSTNNKILKYGCNDLGLIITVALYVVKKLEEEKCATIEWSPQRFVLAAGCFTFVAATLISRYIFRPAVPRFAVIREFGREFKKLAPICFFQPYIPCSDIHLSRGVCHGKTWFS